MTGAKGDDLAKFCIKYHDDYWTWYLDHVFVTDYEQRVRQNLLYTHSLRADRPVNVRFFGNPEGSVTINSPAKKSSVSGSCLTCRVEL